MTTPVSSPAPVVPVAASTLLLLRDGAGGLEVLMTARHEDAGFAAGALVFPGGKVDPGDARLVHLAPGLAGLAPDEAAYRIAALRETFEESGLLLLRRRGERRLLDAQEAAELAGGGADFATLASRPEFEPAADLLLPYAHWITPLDRPKRFDTRFYVAPFASDQQARHDGRENVESRWCDPAEVVRWGEAGTAKLVFATRMNLLRLAQSANVDSALAAARAQPLVTVVPEFIKTAAGPRIRIPATAGYGGPEIEPLGIVRA
jgi:8-oxo-dGTP pyrophosphatase MutT (NUDIX family)